MISKTTQPTLINYRSINSLYDAKFTKCGDSENSFSFESYGISNNCLLRKFSTGNSGTGEPSMLHHEQTISGEEMHTLIAFMVIVMTSNTVNGL